MKALPHFWRMIEQQTIFNQSEIVFLDSGSTDGTLEFIKTKHCSVHSLVGAFNFGKSCNQIADLSTAPVLMFLSGHVFLEQNYALQAIAELLETHPMGAAYLRQVPNDTLGLSVYERAYLARRFSNGNGPVLVNTPGSFSNAASAMTRAAWQRLRFQEVHGSEDFLWVTRHLELGGEVFYLPHLCAMHSHNETAEQVGQRVRTNAVARGEVGSILKAAYFFGGVYVSMRRLGSSHREALDYASAHARGYL
jgi:glycosyltransferase involved in cell wall biosynthesis